MRDRRVSQVWVLTVLLVGVSFLFPAEAAQSLPSKPLSLVGGGSLDLQGLKGQVVVIRFLASW